MADITDIRARLKDRQVKEGALGKVEVYICLDLSLIDDLNQAKTALDDTAAETTTPGRPRLGGTETKVKPDPAIVKAQAAVDQADAAVKSASLRLQFRALGSAQYQQVMNAHPDANDGGEAYADFLNDLCDRCLMTVTDGDGDEQKGLTWTEIAAECTYGEWESNTVQVLALNRRKVDVPFSSRPSKPTLR